jgi:cytidylate kinase
MAGGARVIAIDGPVGAGKSTVARALAQRLGVRYVDTGAMYRAVAYLAARRGIAWEDRAAVAALARRLEIAFEPAPDGQRVRVDGLDVTEAIRAPQISEGASVVSAYPEVREALVALQRRMAGDDWVVMEGRDIGTVVFPDAAVKIYLEASLDERARRRHRELLERGEAVRYEEVREAMRARDQRDATRAHSPLRPAPDALIIDSTALSVEQVVDAIAARLPRR